MHSQLLRPIKNVMKSTAINSFTRLYLWLSTHLCITISVDIRIVFVHLTPNYISWSQLLYNTTRVARQERSRFQFSAARTIGYFRFVTFLGLDLQFFKTTGFIKTTDQIFVHYLILNLNLAYLSRNIRDKNVNL